MSAADSPPASAPPRSAPGLALLVLAALACLAVGGYGGHWRWTGIDAHSATLWDWLNLILLPATFLAIPIWLRAWNRLGRRHVALAGGALAPFVVLVLLGYLVPLAWTGFTGNTLWDWLQLVLFPAAVASWPVWAERRFRMVRRWAILAGVLCLGLLVAIFGGYLGGWPWTGLGGKTAWDWLHLVRGAVRVGRGPPVGRPPRQSPLHGRGREGRLPRRGRGRRRPGGLSAPVYFTPTAWSYRFRV